MSSASKGKVFVLGLPHTQTTSEFITCAFTIKTLHLCRMLTERGYEVIHLGVAGSTPVCAEHVSVVSADLYRKYLLKDENAEVELIRAYVHGVKREIRARAEPKTAIVCATYGQQNATHGLDQLIVESGVGYERTFAQYRAFDSYAWMHYIYGTEKRLAGGCWYDAVIPPACDPEMFAFKAHKQDYLFYLGRLNDDKGIALACEIAKQADRRIIIMGPGDPARFLDLGSHVSYYPPTNAIDRRDLLANAAALLCPTIYIEPFGCVAIEAQMSGTPVICTDWGGFTETVPTVLTRCRAMRDFVWAARNIEHVVRPHACREWALSKYSLQPVGALYDAWLSRLFDLLHGSPWDAPAPAPRS